MRDSDHKSAFNKIWLGLRLAAGVALLGWLAPGTSIQAAANPAFSRDQVKSLVRRIEMVRQDSGIPAVGFTLVQGEKTLYAGSLGTADLASGRRVNSKTRFRIGSITKTFTALGILAAARDGLVTLDAAFIDVIPDPPFDNPWRSDSAVTLAQLLEHSAGFQDMTWDEFRYSNPQPVDLEAALALHRGGRSTLWRPGLHSSYSNLGAALAGRMLEQVTGTSFEEFLNEQVLIPLGMSSASWFLDNKTRRYLANGYQADGRTPIPYWHMIYRPFGALNISVEDMAPLLSLLIQRGRYRGRQLFEPEMISRMETPATTLAARSGLAYGYGLGNYPWHREGQVFHGHGGDGDGYLAHFGYSPAAGVGYFVVITAFSHPHLRRLRTLIEETIAATLPTPQPPAVASGDFSHLTGRYIEATQRFPRPADRPAAILELSRRNGRLFTQIGKGPERELVPVTPRLFRRPDETVATIAAVDDGRGNIILQGDLGNYRRVKSD